MQQKFLYRLGLQGVGALVLATGLFLVGIPVGPASAGISTAELPPLPGFWEYEGAIFDPWEDGGVLQTNFYLDRTEIYNSCPGPELICTGHHGGTHVAVHYQEDGLWHWRPAFYAEKDSIPGLDLFSGCNLFEDPEADGSYFVTYQRSGSLATHVLFYASPLPVSGPEDIPYDTHALLTGRDEPREPGDPICYGGMWTAPVFFDFDGTSCLLSIVKGYREDEGPGLCHSTYPLVFELGPGETWNTIPRNRYKFIWTETDTGWVRLRWNAIDILGGQPIPGWTTSSNASGCIFLLDSSKYLLIAGAATKKSEGWGNPTTRGFITLYRFLDEPPPEPPMAYRVELVQKIVDPEGALPNSPAMVGGFGLPASNPIRLEGESSEVPHFLCHLERREADDPDRWIHLYDSGPHPVPGGFTILRGSAGEGDPEFYLEPPDPGIFDYRTSYPVTLWPAGAWDDVLMKTARDSHSVVLHVPNRDGSFDLAEAQVLFDLDDVNPNPYWKVSGFQACFLGVFPAEPRTASGDLVMPLSFEDRSDSTHLCHTYIMWEDLVTSTGEDEGALPRSWTATAHPTPFGRDASVRFSLREAGPVTLSIYDVTGRQVRALESEFPAGDLHCFSWDGRDNAGRETRSGFYFFRLETAERTWTGKMIRVR